MKQLSESFRPTYLIPKPVKGVSASIFLNCENRMALLFSSLNMVWFISSITIYHKQFGEYFSKVMKLSAIVSLHKRLSSSFEWL